MALKTPKAMQHRSNKMYNNGIHAGQIHRSRQMAINVPLIITTLAAGAGMWILESIVYSSLFDFIPRFF